MRASRSLELGVIDTTLTHSLDMNKDRPILNERLVPRAVQRIRQNVFKTSIVHLCSVTAENLMCDGEGWG